MAVKIALAVGLFIVICGSPGLKSSQVVPEGLVYTEVKKTLVRGVQGVLTCRFDGVPIAVYWETSRNPDDQSLMVVWFDGEVSGPRFDDGSCDVDENYSLIINNVSTADSGRMYCTVSNNKGPVMKNYTDILVLDTAITTNQQATLQLRQATYGILQCIVHIRARRVSWKKRTTSLANESLVVIKNNKDVVERSGTVYDEGLYNITRDYSLVIKEVQVHHEGLYICEVTDYSGISFRNHTFVNVVVFAALTLLISTVTYCIWRKKHHHYSAIPRHAPHLGLEVHFSAVPRSAPHLELEDIVGITDQAQEVFQVLEQRVNDLLMQHYRLFHDLLGTKSAIQAEKIISENRIALFNSHQMLLDWREIRTSTRAKETIDNENEPEDAWPHNEELRAISRHLTQESMKKVCKKLKINYQYDDANDEGKRLAALHNWRTKVSDKSVSDNWNQLFLALESNNLGGLLPSSRGPCIYKADIVNLAFRLLMHDLSPIAKQLGINVTKLASYRSTFHPSHLEIGTIKLLIELQEDDVNDVFVRIISTIHYQTVGIRGVLVYDMSYGELCSISEAINQRAGRRAGKTTSGMLREELGNLQDVLQLTGQDIAHRLDTSYPVTAFALFKIWKEKPRSLVFNYRAALAHELRTNGMPGLADEIIAGKYIDERTSLAFIEHMVQGLNQDEIRSLGELLQLSGEEEQWHTSTPTNEISKLIYYWVAAWTRGIKVPMEITAKIHRDLNDRLVEHGFLDLAREIIIIEQQLGCKYFTKKTLGI